MIFQMDTFCNLLTHFPDTERLYKEGGIIHAHTENVCLREKESVHSGILLAFTSDWL